MSEIAYPISTCLLKSIIHHQIPKAGRKVVCGIAATEKGWLISYLRIGSQGTTYINVVSHDAPSVVTTYRGNMKEYKTLDALFRDLLRLIGEPSTIVIESK